jgi:creatinine amidohydrolase
MTAEETLRARLSDLPRCLGETARACGPAPASRAAIVTTGIGASEGPARAMAAFARAAWGAPATFVPLSAFVDGAPAGERLIVFSQGLSPNARLALARANDFAGAALFTSVRRAAAAPEVGAALDAFGGEVVVLPQCAEEGTLVRVLGPPSALFAAALYTGLARAEELGLLLSAIASANVDAAPLDRRVAFVTAGGYGGLCHAARNVWLEALCAPEPHAWDVLQVAHGPFQEFFEREILLVALERAAGEEALFDRLEQLLVPARHALVRLRSELPWALAPIHHFAQVCELVCAALRARPRDLAVWPGSGRDAPLYELGRDVTGTGRSRTS